jgi:predicted dehydrogenase
LNFYERPTQHWLTIGGATGRLRLDFETGTLVGRTGAAEVHETTPDGFDRNTLFVNEMRHFIEVCQGREAPGCGLDEGCASLAIIQAARQGAPMPPGAVRT